MLRLAPLEVRTVGPDPDPPAGNARECPRIRPPAPSRPVLPNSTARLLPRSAAPIAAPRWRMPSGSFTGRGCDVILIAGARRPSSTGATRCPLRSWRRAGRSTISACRSIPAICLLLARLGEARVLGLPGCARSLKLNGFDWVLQRVFAGVEVTASDIMRMGGRRPPDGDSEPPVAPQPRLPPERCARGRGGRPGITAPHRRSGARGRAVAAHGRALNKLLIEGGRRADGAPRGFRGARRRRPRPWSS